MIYAFVFRVDALLTALCMSMELRRCDEVNNMAATCLANRNSTPSTTMDDARGVRDLNGHICDDPCA